MNSSELKPMVSDGQDFQAALVTGNQVNTFDGGEVVERYQEVAVQTSQHTPEHLTLIGGQLLDIMGHKAQDAQSLNDRLIKALFERFGSATVFLVEIHAEGYEDRYGLAFPTSKGMVPLATSLRKDFLDQVVTMKDQEGQRQFAQTIWATFTGSILSHINYLESLGEIACSGQTVSLQLGKKLQPWVTELVSPRAQLGRVTSLITSTQQTDHFQQSEGIFLESGHVHGLDIVDAQAINQQVSDLNGFNIRAKRLPTWTQALQPGYDVRLVIDAQKKYMAIPLQHMETILAENQTLTLAFRADLSEVSRLAMMLQADPERVLHAPVTQLIRSVRGRRE